MNIEELLQEYKNISLNIVEKIKNEADVLDLFKTREEIIGQISKLDVDKQVVRNKIEQFKIMELDKEIEQLIQESMVNVKKEIVKVRKSKQAYNQYSSFSKNNVIFNTKR